MTPSVLAYKMLAYKCDQMLEEKVAQIFTKFAKKYPQQVLVSN